jgi:formyl-CoA transferase
MVSTSRQFDALCAAIDRPDLVIDERFATSRAREANGDALFAEIAAWTRQRTKHEVMQYLGPRGVPCSAILDSHDLWEDEHLRARGAITRIEHPTRGAWDLLSPPFHMEDSHVGLAPSPLLGEHTDEVLTAELGLDPAELARLARAGVTARPEAPVAVGDG